MARVGITEAAARLGLSVDSVRRRVRKGELTAQRDNKGVWWVEVADGDVPMQRQPSATLAPAYAPPMQPPGTANGHDGSRELVDALRGQVADLTRRLDAAEAERGRLLALVETMTARPPAGPQSDDREADRIAAAEARAAELQGVLDVELPALRRQVAALAQPRRRARRGLLGRLLGR